MKTRAQIYGQEAAGLLRIISMYPGLSEGMLCRFYPEKEAAVPAVLFSLRKQGRVCVGTGGGYFPGRAAGTPDSGLIRSVWVLLDFIDKVEFHSAGEFPAKVAFFAGGELYEILHAAEGQEALVAHILSRGREGEGKKIVLVDEPGQAARLRVAGPGAGLVSGFCTVDKDGRVQYYQKT